MENRSSQQAVWSALTPPSHLNSGGMLGQQPSGLAARSWHVKPAWSLDHTVDLCLSATAFFLSLQSQVSTSFSFSTLCCYFTTLSLPSLVLPVFLCVYSSFLYLCVCLHLSDLPVNHVSQMYVQKRILHSPLDCRALFKSQWDNYSRTLSISLTWLAGQHGIADHHKEKKESASARKGLPLPVSVSVSLSHTLSHSHWSLDALMTLPLSECRYVHFFLFILRSHHVCQTLRKADMSKHQLTGSDLCEYMYMMHWGQKYTLCIQEWGHFGAYKLWK